MQFYFTHKPKTNWPTVANFQLLITNCQDYYIDTVYMKTILVSLIEVAVAFSEVVLSGGSQLHSTAWSVSTKQSKCNRLEGLKTVPSSLVPTRLIILTVVVCD